VEYRRVDDHRPPIFMPRKYDQMPENIANSALVDRLRIDYRMVLVARVAIIDSVNSLVWS